MKKVPAFTARRQPVGYFTEHGEVHPIMGPEQRRSTSSHEPTLWDSIKKSTDRAPRDPIMGEVRRHRAELRRRAAVKADETYAELGDADVRMMDAPPKDRARRGGEWDWFDRLHPTEQARLRRSWFRPKEHPGYGSNGPDQVADTFAKRYGRTVTSGSDMGEEIDRWVTMTRVADGARALSRGRVPRANAYGNISKVNLVGDTELDADKIFSDKATAADYLRRRRSTQAEEDELREERDRAARARMARTPARPDDEEDF